MKKWMFVVTFILFGFISSCGNENVNNISEDVEYAPDENYEKTEVNNGVDGGNEEMETDTINRSMIAEALGVEENSRNIRFILNCLNTVEAGQIQSAETDEINGEKVINVIAEDGTEYQIYLSGSGSVEAVKNLSTGEWPVQSYK